MSGELSTAGGMRAGDADRERVANLLREHAQAGRLDVDELSERLEAAYTARTLQALEPLMADLPPASPPAPSRRDRAGTELSALSRRLAATGQALPIFLALVAVWAATGAGAFWPAWVMLFILLRTGVFGGSPYRAGRRRHGSGYGRRAGHYHHHLSYRPHGPDAGWGGEGDSIA